MRTIIFSLFTLLILSSCGQDGQDGRAYLSFSWDIWVDEYSDDNYSIPTIIEELTYYETEPGTYSYEYYCSDGADEFWGYEGTYTISIYLGEEGGFLHDGADGADSYFDFDLTGDGSSFSFLKGKKKAELMKKNEINLFKYKKIHVGENEVKTYISGKGRMEISKQKFILIKK